MGARLWALCETSYCVIALLVLMGAYVGLPLKLAGATLAHGDHDPVNTVAQAFVCGGLIVFSSIRWRQVAFVISRGGLMNLFLLLALCSALWSFDPGTTVRRVGTMMIEVGFAYYMLASSPFERIIALIAFCVVVSALSSTAVAVAMPGIGRMTGTAAGAWNGVFVHKNQLGWVMIQGCLACGWLFVARPKQRILYGAGLLICFALAILSHSRSSQIIIIMMPLLGIGITALRLPGLARLWAIYAAIVASLAVMVVTAVFFVDIMHLLGKDPSFTGRLPLWIVLSKLAWQHAPLGYGYGAFFLTWNPDLEWMLAQIGWDAAEAHQAYLELFLTLGVPGLVLAVAILFSTIRTALICCRSGTVSWASYAAIYAISFTMIGFVEALLLKAGDVNTTILTLCYVGLRLQPVRRRQLRPFPATVDMLSANPQHRPMAPV